MEDLHLQNTLTKEKEIFNSITPHAVRMYTCGPTVYNFAHIGNLRAYYFADTLKRALMFNGYAVRHVMNITDIGHLTSDADDGEDKMVKALKREGKPMTLEGLREVSHFYFEKFKEDFLKLNLILPEKFTFASEHIPEQVDLIQKLDSKGFVYKTSDGLYFDTSKDSEYGVLGGIFADEAHSRIGLNKEKRNPEDFALWKFSDEDSLGFPAPFGNGFPGWHIECSAMAMKYLGAQFDIHTGGIDHIRVHHNNEIAQSKAVTGKIMAKYWIHNNHITISGDKMAKSGENFLSLSFMEEHGISPMAVRLWYMQSRYSTRVDYSLEALKASETAWKKLKGLFLELPDDGFRISYVYREKFVEAINDDLDTPKALTIVWELLKDTEIPAEEKRMTLLNFDQVLGFNLKNLKHDDLHLSKEIESLISQRKEAREKKDWNKSDELRHIIREHGFDIRDMDDEQVITRSL